MDSTNIAGFDWDKGNWPKCEKHGVSKIEIEECFYREIMIFPDPYPIEAEKRFNAVGINGNNRKIFIVFTFRKSVEGTLIRPISARYMHKKEIEHYAKQKKT